MASSTRSFLLCLLAMIFATSIVMIGNQRLPWGSCKAHTKSGPGSRVLLMFTGRWKYLRLSLPYIYRDLTKNGGVLDKVLFVMIQYNNETYTKLNQFATVSNKLLEEEVFELRFMAGYKPGESPTNWQTSDILRYIYDQIFTDLRNNPYNQYLKVDDDVVYYHMDALRKMFANKDSANCFMHFGNIAGSNWRCSIIHQRMGVFNLEVNPNNLIFEYDPGGECGWGSKCADLTLRAFIHHYKHQQLDKYLFDGLELLLDRKRFSMHLFLLDKDLIRVKELMEVGPITNDDEGWWTEKYAPKPSIEQSNCIVGEALVVHFAYSQTEMRMLELGFLKDFENISQLEVGSKMPQSLWKLLDY